MRSLPAKAISNTEPGRTMRILNIQRMSTEDGPGLRTTLFVKGCPLSCAWCHNPESLSPLFQIEWQEEGCLGCGTCVSLCPVQALTLTEDGLRIDRCRCDLCLRCVEACPTRALESRGEDWTVDELFSELIKDRAYFGADGGITLSGGEIMVQAGEAADLLKAFKEAGIHTAIDTSGLCSREALDRVLPWTDLVLYDLKLADSQEHKQWTGVDNGRILENFRYLLARKNDLGYVVWVRTPIIPGATDSDDNIRALAEVVGKGAEVWELCAFNNLCADKYERLGAGSWQFAGVPLMTGERMRELEQLAREAGCPQVRATGNTRLENTSDERPETG